MVLTEEEQKTLLSIARRAIKSFMDHRDIDIVKNEIKKNHEISGILEEKRGAFVTLKKMNSLRGCIGYIDPIKPLYLTVIENAVNAAFSDFRFPPLNAEEVDHINIEISVLSPIEPLSDIESIVIGRDGLIIKKGFRQGLLLPQVASEYNWDKYEFLSHTCIKAGLPSDEWKNPGTEIRRFSSFVFGESKTEQA